MKDNAVIIKFRDGFDNVFGGLARKMDGSVHLTALRNGMMFTLPFTLLGGIFMILAFPPIPGNLEGGNIFSDFLLGWQSFAASTPQLLIPYYLTIGFMAVYIVLGVSYNLAKSYKLNAIYVSASALFVFLAIAGQPTSSDNGMMMPMGSLDANGMFTGIFIAFFVVEVSRFLIKHNIKIKMPDSVPPMVTAPFEMLIPLTICLISALLLNTGSENLFGHGLVSLVQMAIQPLLTATDSLPSVILVNLLVMGFWFFGIHGASMLATIIGPIQASNLVDNASAYAAGEVIPHVFAGSVKSIFGTVIMYQALLFAVLLFAKSARLKSLAKISLVPNLFNINEPMLFGLPVVMNLTLIVPIIITVIINTATFYILMSADVIGRLVISLTPTIPGPINAYLSTMDWKAPILWIILFAINLAIFTPFVKSYDKEVLTQEQLENEAKA